MRRPQAAMIKPRASLRWLGLLVVPSAFLITATEISGEASFIAALGRPLLVLSMLAMGLFFWRVYKLFSPIIREMRRKAPDSYWSRTRGVWVMLLVSTPLALALASILGYHYAASNLTELLALTLFYLLALLLLNEILLRWLYVSERRLRLEAALRQREENRAEREKASGEHMDAPEIDVPELDYKSLGAQGRAMVRATVLVAAVAGLLTVWSELLPAFSVLDAVHLPFSRTTIIDGVAEQVPVTLLDLGVAFLILVGTLFAAKNLSGFLEFTVLKYINIDIGGRYAIVTLCQYIIVAVGVIACFSVIGWKWSNIQWLVAALSVGLGFGLQEIVANFVSGIILLLERPIRIGDTVTIGDQGGVVSRIQIRATTIITWEKKELLVPNKEFITGRVLNWSLTGELTRVLINVGIAYGADVTKAMKLILETAKEHEHIVEDPEPIVTFEAFGDNSLSLFLRAYCDSLDLRLHVMTELNEAIYGKLNAAGIPIAFPQRDVHLDTLKPLEIKVLRGQTGESGA